MHSDTCSQSKRILEELLLSTKNARLSDFLETKSGDAYLCYQCDGKATSLHKLQQRVTEVQNELVDKLKELHAVTATGPRKRLYVNVQNSADKRPRLDSQCDQRQIQKQVKRPVISYILSITVLILVTSALRQNYTMQWNLNQIKSFTPQP